MHALSVGTPAQGRTPTAHVRPLALVVDDDRQFCDLMVRSLDEVGFSAVGVYKGGPVVDMLREQPRELVLLDLLMPDVDGISICRELRTFSKAAVIMVTAMSHTKDIVDAYLAGADSVIVKPFQFHVALARISAVMRRAFPAYSTPDAPASTCTKTNIKRSGNEVVLDGRTIYLSELEYRVYSLLFLHAGQPFSKQALLKEIWGDSDQKNGGVVEQTIKRLRARIDSGPAAKKLIVTCDRGYYACQRQRLPADEHSEHHEQIKPDQRRQVFRSVPSAK